MTEINHHDTVEKRIDAYIENLEEIRTTESEDDIIEAISDNSLDVYLENQMGISICHAQPLPTLRDDDDAISVVSWLGVIGFIITVAQVIRKNLENYRYIPFWRKGSDDKAYSYEFQTKQSSEDPKIDVFMNFFKRVYRKEKEFGFMFGEVDKKKKNKVTVEAIIPVEELADVLEELQAKNQNNELLKVSNEKYNKRDKKAVKALNNLIGNIRTGNVAGKENIIKEVIDLLLAKRKHIILTQQKINLLEEKLSPEEKVEYTAEICKTGIWEKLKAKPIIGRTTYLRSKFLGTYYYENKLLKDAWMPEKLIEKFDFSNIKKTCNVKNFPKLLFFTKENFEKIDSIMRGCLPFFEDEKRKDLPILVCLDRNSVIARSMCIAYKTEEGIYKRIRNYSPAKKKN